MSLRGRDGAGHAEGHRVASLELEDDPDLRRSLSPAAPHAEAGARAALAWALALCTITAYSFNSQVFVWIGSADYGGKLFELFLFHVVATVFLPVAAATGGVRGLVAAQGMSLGRFAANVVIGAFFQMEIYYLWFQASLRIPTQLLAAIFQSAIAFVYVLSLCFLDERFCWVKTSGVVLALLGIVVATGALSGGASGSRAPPEGVALALGAELSKATYQVWFKRTFGETSPRFTMLFGGSVGLAHVFPVLPILAVLNALGLRDARMGVGAWTPQQAGLILLGAIIAGSVNVGSMTVIALRSPLFWASMQMLAIPLSVFFDLVIRGIKPGALNVLGYTLIIAAFPLLACQLPWCAPQQGAKAALADPEDADEDDDASSSTSTSTS